MKLKTMLSASIALALGLGANVFAASNYAPPERLQCTVSDSGILSCSNFNRSYLTEGLFSADIPHGKEMVYAFVQGYAFQAGQHEWGVFYTYRNVNGKTVKLKSINVTIMPDLAGGKWKQYKDIYTCTTGYMTCPITNLPSFG